MYGKLAGARNEQVTLDANEIAMVEQAKQFPPIHIATCRVVTSAGYIASFRINLQTRKPIRQVHERRFAHHARGRSNSSGNPHRHCVELLVSEFDWLRRRPLTFAAS